MAGPLPRAAARRPHAPLEPAAFPVLSRIGGLPAEDLDLVSARTRATLAAVTRAEAELGTCAAAVVEACFGLVPRLEDDDGLRRRVLAGKRAAHRSRPLPWTATERARVAALLAPAERAALDAHDRACSALAALEATLEESVEEDRTAALDRLHAAIARPGFHESLVVAAPDWVRWARPLERRASTPKDVRTLLSYVARAASKTSPFSGLTTVGVAGGTAVGRARSRTSAELGLQALELLVRDERTAGLFRFRRPVVVAGGPDTAAGLVLVSELVSAEGIVWRDDRVAAADTALPWARLLAGDDDAEVLAHDEVLRRLGGAAPFTRFVRLLDQGVVRAALPWERGEDALAVLADLVGDRPSPVPGATLRRLADGGRSLAALPAPERLRVADDIGAAAGQLVGRGGRPSGAVYEDREAAVHLDDPSRSAPVAARLEALADRVRPWVFRSHVYDLLRDRFVAQHGRGGSTTDPLGFLLRNAVERDQDPEMSAAQAADHRARSHPGERAWLPVGATSAPPSVGVMYQVVGDPADGRIVVNNFGSGTGALFARFATLLGDDFGDDLRRGVRTLWRGRPTRELTVWTDCNTAQAECSGVLPPLLVPGEPGASGALRLEDAVLTHDAMSDTLALTDAAGEPFGLAYLGLTPKHLLQGYLRLLGALADPWINASPDVDYTVLMQGRLAALCGTGVVAVPRVEHDGLVTRRASWIVPRELLPVPGGPGGDAGLVRAAHRLRDEHGMPEEVFVHQLGGWGTPMGGTRKPIWTSFASATALRVLQQTLAPETRHLRVVEALPARSEHAQRDAEGRPVVAEHAALLHWAVPAPGEAVPPTEEERNR